jgi:transposase
MTTTTRSAECTAMTATLFLAMELGSTRWKLAFAVSRATRPRLRTIRAGDLTALWQELTAAQLRFALGPETPVRSCYEAGRDGFWLHRALSAHGINNVVIDPASIAVDRRQRRAKTDRLDASKLVAPLMNAAAGDRRGWREVRVPSVEVEADRHLQREWETVREDRQRIRNRIQGLLVTHGVHVPLTAGFGTRLATVRMWDGSVLPEALIARLQREWSQLLQIEARQRILRRARTTRVQTRSDVVAHQTQQLARLCGVGTNGALTLTTELFAWRAFTNGRQIGAIVGLTPTPYRSDQTVVEQGISRSGNRRVRALSIELAWAWLRYQPASALSRWFEQRFGQHGRARRIGIVALARKLLIAFWRYLDQGVLPEGARVKA